MAGRHRYQRVGLSIIPHHFVEISQNLTNHRIPYLVSIKGRMKWAKSRKANRFFNYFSTPTIKASKIRLIIKLRREDVESIRDELVMVNLQYATSYKLGKP